MKEFIAGMPKAELHLHIEGTFEPEMIFDIGKRNGISLPYNSVEELRSAYHFKNLQEFLDIYYEGAKVLIQEQDFYDLTSAYLRKCQEQNVRHTEIMFDPQTHTERGIAFDTVINGIHRALDDGEKQFGITSRLVMSFLRHLSAESAMETLIEGLRHKDLITAVGLDSTEVGNPPSKFRAVFEKAAAAGFLTQAHAGEEGPPAYIWEALELPGFVRLDHGNRSLEDPELVKELVKRRMPLTICPLSNRRLHVIDHIADHPLKKMLDLGLMVTINSDDPPYFGGYMNENFIAMQEELSLTREEIVLLARNGFEASYLEEGRKQELISELEAYARVTV